MDRRGQHYRPLLNRLRSGAALPLLAAGWLAANGTTHAQQPTTPANPPPSVAAAPDATLRGRMTERRQRELAAGEQDVQRRLEQLSPQEREAFKRNLRVWRQLTPEERQNIRKEATDRTREEVERAYQQSGLHLDKDQREVFGLRYRQERRKLERDLQEKMEAERARRLPGMVDGLKKEFADKSGAPAVLPAPVTSAPTPSVSVPAASPLSGR